MDRASLISKLASRVRVPVQETAREVAEDVLAKFKRVQDVGSSLVGKDEMGAAPIPVEAIHKSEVRQLTEKEMEEFKSQPLYEKLQEALAKLGGVDYFVRVGLYDHRTLFTLLGKLAPRDITLQAGDSWLELVTQAQTLRTVRPVPRDVTPIVERSI